MKKFEYNRGGIYKDLSTNEFVSLDFINTFESCVVEYFDEITYLCYGKLHRIDGPAVLLYKTHDKIELIKVEYWINNRLSSIEDWLKEVLTQSSKKEQLQLLFNLDQVI